MKVLVLDTSAFIMGFNPLTAKAQTYSVPAVAAELLEGTMARVRFRTSQESGSLTLRRPHGSAMQTVMEASAKLGDLYVLSQADLEVLALALDLKSEGKAPTIVSDDYSVQNVAQSMGIEYMSLAAFGISHRFDWIYYCPACFRRYPEQARLGVCEVCGTRLKRKVLRKQRLEQ